MAHTRFKTLYGQCFDIHISRRAGMVYDDTRTSPPKYKAGSEDVTERARDTLTRWPGCGPDFRMN